VFFAESTRRYEVEIQLGATDESHIIRTIEYWDIERKRYPQYEHTAVIVARIGFGTLRTDGWASRRREFRRHNT